MPTYEYRREDGTTFEVLQRITEEPLETCPETGQKVTRMIGGGVGLIFRGSGFYLTDYARKGSGDKASPKEKNGESTASADSTTTKSSTKPSAEAA